jgi:hypothetical protein
LIDPDGPAFVSSFYGFFQFRLTVPGAMHETDLLYQVTRIARQVTKKRQNCVGRFKFPFVALPCGTRQTGHGHVRIASTRPLCFARHRFLALMTLRMSAPDQTAYYILAGKM